MSLDIGVGKNYDSKLFSESWALNPKNIDAIGENHDEKQGNVRG